MTTFSPSAAAHQQGLVATGLGFMQIEVVHDGGTLQMDPNTALMAAHYRNLELGGPVGTSILSGEPGYMYRSSEVQLCFTRDELYRLLGRSLTPQEFHSLHKAFGSFFEIHDDFYDAETGLCLQPLD